VTAMAAPRPVRDGSETLILVLFTLLCVGSVTLFMDFGAEVAGVKIKPFDAVSILTLPPILAVLALGRGLRVSSGTFVYTAFLVWHTVSAFSMDRPNGIRETIQSVELLMLLLTIQQLAPQIAWRSAAKFFAICLAVILAYVGWWHISHGYIAGWKRFDSPKLLFTILPSILLSLMVLRARRMDTLSYITIVLIFIVTILTGERKALLHLFFMCAVLLYLRYFDVVRFTIGVIFAVIIGFFAISANEYIARQFSTISSISQAERVSTAELQAGYLPTSMSNAQRLFSAEVSKDLIVADPWFGIGTNGFLDYVVRAYPGIASWLVVGIHNEFQRVLVENGIIGFALYLIIWLRALVWLGRNWPRLPPWSIAIYLFSYSACIHQALFEGSGNEQFILLIFVALLPEIMDRVSQDRQASTSAQALRQNWLQQEWLQQEGAREPPRGLQGRR
jgi:O-Antigen ligase